jgi:AcrR family transcriptional regulator
MSLVINHTTTTRRSQQERTALSDHRMLEAAIQLIIERGTDGTTLAEVGRRAGYSRGLAGYRFGSKEGLLQFVVRAISDDWLRELTRVTAGKTGYAAICAATDAHYRFCLDDPDHVRAFYILWFESIGPGSAGKTVIAGVHNRRRRDVIAWIDTAIAQGHIDAGIQVESVAAQFCAALVGIVYQWLVAPDALDEIAQLHEGLKSSMRILLGVR